jgi:protein-L-isoaspartate(D-aspartate) O-methyltransferase
VSADPRIVRLVMELRKHGICERVLSAIERTPREKFVDEPFVHAAWHNSALPIACGQTISQPYVVAYATDKLELEPNMRVLEIGTGSGYQAAVLSHLCRRVYTIERHKPLLALAEARFRELKLDNIATRHGDGLKGWPGQAPFDRILLSAAVEEVPVNLIEQLKPGGRLIAPVGAVPKSDDIHPIISLSQHLTQIIRTETGVEQTSLIPVVFVPMVAGLPDAKKSDDGGKKV